jgi:hypothetical protein
LPRASPAQPRHALQVFITVIGFTIGAAQACTIEYPIKKLSCKIWVDLVMLHLPVLAINKDTKHKTQNTKHKTQNTKHKTQNTNKTQNTKHKTQNTETKHNTQNTKHKTQKQHELPPPYPQRLCAHST